jgi:hypothetical protein
MNVVMVLRYRRSIAMMSKFLLAAKDMVAQNLGAVSSVESLYIGALENSLLDRKPVLVQITVFLS